MEKPEVYEVDRTIRPHYLRERGGGGGGIIIVTPVVVSLALALVTGSEFWWIVALWFVVGSIMILLGKGGV